jgi:hypothetical protein
MRMIIVMTVLFVILIDILRGGSFNEAHSCFIFLALLTFLLRSSEFFIFLYFLPVKHFLMFFLRSLECFLPVLALLIFCPTFL